MAIAIVVAGNIGSSDRTGWLLPAWFAVVASVGYGVHSLVFASAGFVPAPVWALAAITSAATYAVAIIHRRRARTTRCLTHRPTGLPLPDASARWPATVTTFIGGAASTGRSTDERSPPTSSRGKVSPY